MTAMTQTILRPGQDIDWSTAEITRRLNVAGRQGGATHALDVGRARLHNVQRAKGAPKGLTAAELRAAPERRRQVLGGEPA